MSVPWCELCLFHLTQALNCPDNIYWTPYARFVCWWFFTISNIRLERTFFVYLLWPFLFITSYSLSFSSHISCATEHFEDLKSGQYIGHFSLRGNCGWPWFLRSLYLMVGLTVNSGFEGRKAIRMKLFILSFCVCLAVRPKCPCVAVITRLNFSPSSHPEVLWICESQTVIEYDINA